MKIENTISSMGIDLPNIAENYKNNTSGAKYVSHYSVGTVLYLSGCTPMKDGKPYMTGVLGDNLSVTRLRSGTSMYDLLFRSYKIRFRGS